MALSVLADLKKLPDSHPLLRRFLDKYSDDPWLRSTLANTSRNVVDTFSEKAVDTEKQEKVSERSLERPRSLVMVLDRDGSKDGGSGGKIPELFAYWQTATNHPAAKLTSERRARIEARLKDGYTVEQIKQAIDGAARGAFVGENGKRYDDIELICRSGSKLESFIGRQAPQSQQTPTGRPPVDPRFAHFDVAAGLVKA